MQLQTPQRFNPTTIGGRPPLTNRVTLPETGAIPASTPQPLPEPPPAEPVGRVSSPGGGLKKLSFGKIGAKKDESSKKTYPVFPDPNGQAAALAATIIQQQDEFDALEGSLKTNKDELKFMVTPEYFCVNHGKAEIPSSIAVKCDAGEVLVSFQNRYKGGDEAGIANILGEERVAKFFREAFELKIKGDLIPADHAQELLDELQELFTKYNCVEALEVKNYVTPTKDFHTARHTALSPDENIALEQVCPIIPQLKTKGRGNR